MKRLKKKWIKKISSVAVSSKYKLSRILFLLSPSQDKQYVIFGEKDGNFARDNAFELFNYLFEQGRPEVYFVATKNCVDRSRLEKYGKRVLSYNSLRHFIYLSRAKLLVVNDGYRDVYPDVKGALRNADIPFAYLQHGILRYKRVHFTASHYWGRVLRFVASLDSEVEILRDRMMTKADDEASRKLALVSSSLGLDIDPESRAGLEALSKELDELADKSHPRIAAEARKVSRQAQRLRTRVGFPEARLIQSGLPRHDRLLERLHAGDRRPKEVVVFFTWRDSCTAASPRGHSPFVTMVASLLGSDEVAAFTREHSISFRLVIHHKQKTYASQLSELLPDYVVVDGDADIGQLMGSAALVTDYSSVAFDFCLAGTPVIFYQPDWVAYQESRGDYTRAESDWIGPRTRSVTEFIKALRDVIGSQNGNQRRVELLSEYPNFGRSCEVLGKEIYRIPPRVVFVVYNIFGTGGTVRTVTNFANYLFDKGYQVEVVSLRRNKQEPDLGLHPSIRVHSLQDHMRRQRWFERKLGRRRSFLFNKKIEQYPLLNMLMDVRLARFLALSTADVIIPTFPGLVPICNAFKRRKTRVLVQENQFYEAYDEHTQRIIRSSYSKADAVTVLSDKDMRDQSAFAKKVFKLPNGVATVADRSWPDKPSRPRIVGVGRLQDWKRFDLLVSAFSMLSAEFPEWDVHIFGEGAERGNLEEQISSLGLADRVFLNGLTDDPIGEIHRGEIFALPSSHEPFGMVITEAYAASRPVVSFDVETGPKELVINGHTGFRAEALSAESFAGALRLLMLSPETRAEMGRNAKQLFDEKYTISAAGEVLEHIINEVTGTTS